MEPGNGTDLDFGAAGRDSEVGTSSDDPGRVGRHGWRGTTVVEMKLGVAGDAGEVVRGDR